MRQKYRDLSIVKWIIQTCLISIIVVSSLVVLSCSYLISKIVNNNYIKIADATSSHIAALLDSISEGDFHYNEENGTLYKGDYLITDEFFALAHADDGDIHHTIFWGDTRVLTDMQDESGNLVTGTKLTDQKIINALRTEGRYSEDNVEIYGEKFSVSYYPLKNDSNGETVGYVFVGVVQDTANIRIFQDVMLIAVEAIVSAILISFGVSKLIKLKSSQFDMKLDEASAVADSKKGNVNKLGSETMEHMDQINNAIDQVSMAVTSQASSTEEIMGSMEEFGTSIDVIMDQVENTSQVANDSMNMIDAMKAQIERLEKVSAENNEEIINISKKVEQDGIAVANISQIIDAINSIAFQITILSFNASVEAARAGEAGKGFAVVADSIKSLSDKTKESLDEITKIVVTVNEEVEDTMKTSENLVLKNEKMMHELVDTKTSMDRVTTAFENISNNIREIKSESGLIMESKEQVVESVSSLAAISQQNAAMSEEMKATSLEVVQTTTNLLVEIEQLKEINHILDKVKASFSGKAMAK